MTSQTLFAHSQGNHYSSRYPLAERSVRRCLQTQWERLVSKTEGAQAVAEHEESLSSYWLLLPFKLYAYWWSFAFAYFSGETPECPVSQPSASSRCMQM